MQHNFRPVLVDKVNHRIKFLCQNPRCNASVFKIENEDIAESVKRANIDLDGCGKKITKEDLGTYIKNESNITLF